MAELNDVYGTWYQSETKSAKNNYVCNTIANNVAHRQFNFKISDTGDGLGRQSSDVITSF